MEGRVFAEILVSILVLVVGSQLVKGFATDKCPHDDLTAQIKQTMKCTDNSNHKSIDQVLGLCKEIKESKELPLSKICKIGMEYLSTQIKCENSIASTCFDDKIARLYSDASTVFEGPCAPKNLSQLGSHFQTKFMTLVQKVNSELTPDPMQHLMASIKFDTKCSMQELVQEMSKAQRNCPTMQIMQKPNPMENLCNTVGETLGSCLKPNRCVSEREIGLLRNLMYTVYHMSMEIMGRLDSVKDTCDFDEMIGGNMTMRLGQPSASAMVDMVVKDYKTESCQNQLRGFSLLSSATIHLGSKLLSITVFLSSILLI